jgi:hypothetical protein
MVKMVCILFIFFVGIYSSIKGTSHRARIPSTLNWQFKIYLSSSLYTLNVSSGKNFFFLSPFNYIIFVGIFIETHENDEVRIERRLFASQEYQELLLAHVVLTRKTPKG